jgi:hypothetical protein
MALMNRFAATLAFSLLATLALGCGGGIGSTGGDGTTGGGTAGGQSVAGPLWGQGQSVEVEWQGSWYAATILGQEPNGLFRIHYDGWSDEWDEAVDASRVRAPGDGTDGQLVTPDVFASHPGAADDNSGTTVDPGGWTPTPDTDLPPGLAIHVEWRGSWYRAEIVNAPPYGETCRVHYTNWDAEWDEDVPRERVRVGGQ